MCIHVLMSIMGSYTSVHNSPSNVGIAIDINICNISVLKEITSDLATCAKSVPVNKLIFCQNVC